MGKALTPVSVNGIEFDALIESEHTLSSEIPEYSVEDGYTISDSIILAQEELSMTLYLSDMPVTWKSRHRSSHVESTIAKLQELYYSKSTFSVVTTDKTYTDMAIESISFTKNFDTGYAREIPIVFKQIRKTSTQVTTVPSTYGKSGTTKSDASTANTTSKSGTTTESNKTTAAGLYDSAVTGLNYLKASLGL